MHLSSLLFTVLLTPASAWLPGLDKILVNRDGVNLFNASDSVNGTASKRYLKGSGSVRGVNLGSLFVFEPWIGTTEWKSMGCTGMKSEFDCVSKLGQSKANTVFQAHWNTWITKADITKMHSYGLNTIRIPVGYWMMESLVYDSEHFPQGGFAYLERLCGWATAAGMYIIIDLHGFPGAQVANNSDTGQYAATPGAYVSYQFNRATQFLSWITTQIHTNSNFSNVGMLEIINEPVQNANKVGTLRSEFYPNAFTAIRNAEKALGVAGASYLHIQMMNTGWGSGDPTTYLTNNYYAAYDSHRYLKWGAGDLSANPSQELYISTSCSDSLGKTGPTIVGEFSLAVPDKVEKTAAWATSTQQAFYTKWFAAQIQAYEKTTLGWVFWTWKSELGDYRWSYQDAVTAGVIPTNLQTALDASVC